MRLESQEVHLKMKFEEEEVHATEEEEEVQLHRAREIPGTLQQRFRATHGN